MKQKFLTMAAAACMLAALSLTSCEYDDSEIWEQVNQNTERIAALEAWQAETNTNIQSLQALLSTTDYITAVTTVMENGVEVGYTISFINSPAITIYHGQKGDTGAAGTTPRIGVTRGDDDNWYWTLNGQPMTDDGGNHIRANGTQGLQGETGTAAPTPRLSTGSSLTGVTADTQGNAIVADAIYLSVDDGQTWTRVSGDKGDTGDSFFRSVDTSNPTCVTFTLDNGTSFSIPRQLSLKLTFDTPTVRLGYGNTLTVTFTAEGSDSFTPDNLIIVTPDGWKASIPAARSTMTTDFSMTITAPTENQLTSGTAVAEGDILLILDNGQGETTLGRMKADCKDIYLVLHNVAAGELAAAIDNRTDMTHITVTGGTINETDWEAVANCRDALVDLDLAGATYTGANADNIEYQGYMNVTRPIVSVKLPQGITGLAKYAFSGCDNLTSITLPDGLTTLKDYALSSCGLTSITLPDELTSIGLSVFSRCEALTSITLPDGVTSISPSLFAFCKSLTSITLPDGVTSIGAHAFDNCEALTTLTLPGKVTSIGERVFAFCNSLTTLICQAEMPPTLGDSPFIFISRPSSISIQVPATSVDAYKEAANWSTYAHLITAIP